MHHQLRHCWRLHLSFGSRRATCTQRVCPLMKPPFCSSSIYFGGNTHLRPERERGGRQPGMCKHLLAYTAWASAAPKRHQMLPLIVKMIEMRLPLPLLLLLERSWMALGMESVRDFMAICRVATSVRYSASAATFRLIFTLTEHALSSDAFDLDQARREAIHKIVNSSILQLTELPRQIWEKDVTACGACVATRK